MLGAVDERQIFEGTWEGKERGEETPVVMEAKQKGSKEEVTSSAKTCKEGEIRTKKESSDLSPRKALVPSEEQWVSPRGSPASLAQGPKT